MKRLFYALQVMKGVFLYLNILALCFLFSGCPYESNVPIDNPCVKVDPKLIGVWKSMGQSKRVLKVSKQDEFTYKIEITGHSENYFAFISLVNGASFLNISEKQKKSNLLKYYLCKIEIKSEGMILISEVSDFIKERFSSQSKLKIFIAANMKNSYFFHKTEYSLINEDQIVKLNKDIKIKELELSESRTFNSLIIAVLVLLLVVSFSLWLNVSGKRKTDKLIFEKKEFSALLQGQVTERKRIASDLHDRVGSILSTVKVYFNALEESIGNRDMDNATHYEKANILLDEACEEVRRISYDLASDLLVNSGLIPALTNLKEVISKSQKIDINILIFGLTNRLDNIVEIAVFRIIQEMVSNILKHSNANEVTIQLNRYGNNLNIVVEDNGIGFDLKTAKEKNGMGLKNIESRVKSLNGKFVIDTFKGTGTTMIIDIPV